MRSNPYFTVVMPVYNVEKHMESAILSVLNQSFKDIQLILVNDCSTDNSGNICDKYKNIDDRVEVIHKEKNEGLSEARNTGIERIKGQYVLFMDSDDYIDLDLFQKVYDELIINPAKVVLWGLTEEYYKKDGSLDYKKEITYKKISATTKDEVRKCILDLEEKTLYGYAWNKCYEVEYLMKHEFKYETITMIEDIVFNINFFQNINSLVILDTPSYHYCNRNNGSLTGKFLKDYFPLHKKRIELLLNQQKEWGICNEEVKGRLGRRYCRYFLSALQRNCDKRANFTHKDRKRWIKEQYNTEIFQAIVPYAQSDNIILKAIISSIQRKKINRLLVLGRLIYFIKDNYHYIFIRLKQNR